MSRYNHASWVRPEVTHIPLDIEQEIIPLCLWWMAVLYLVLAARLRSAGLVAERAHLHTIDE